MSLEAGEKKGRKKWAIWLRERVMKKLALPPAPKIKHPEKTYMRGKAPNIYDITPKP